MVFFVFSCIECVAKEAALFESISSTTDLSLLRDGLEDHRLSQEFLTRFAQEVPRIEYNIFDRFGTFSRWNWIKKSDKLGYGIHDSLNTAGANAFGDVISDSLRETAVAVFPVDYWGEVIADAFTGIVGNTAEERVDTLDPNYSASAKTWIDTDRSKKLEWGARPWRTDPYIYGRINFGHHMHGPALSLEFRTGYDIFRAEKLELRVISPLTETTRLAVGAVVSPSRWDRQTPTALLRFEKFLSKRQNSPLLFVGLRSNAFDSGHGSYVETLVRCGFEKIW